MPNASMPDDDLDPGQADPASTGTSGDSDLDSALLDDIGLEDTDGLATDEDLTIVDEPAGEGDISNELEDDA